MRATIIRGVVFALILAVSLGPSTVAYSAPSRQSLADVLRIEFGSLRITPSSPRIGEQATATFSVLNVGAEEAQVPAFLMVAHDLQDASVDFHPDGVAQPDGMGTTIAIPSGGTHTYQVTRAFTRSGVHFAQPMFLDPSSTEGGPAEWRWVQLAIDSRFPDDTRLPFMVRTDPGDDPVMVGAGDIAGCSPGYQDEATAAVLDTTPGTVFTLGDVAYDSGSADEFECYRESWGRESIKSRTFPAVGNHEYLTPHAAGYFDYYGSAAGPRDKGYYSYDLGAWHIVVLNSCESSEGGHNCSAKPLDVQLAWLERDLAEHPTLCTLAYWHHAIFTDGEHFRDPPGDDPANHWMRPAWNILAQHGVDVVLNGHDHNYQRFHRLSADGQPNAETGIREFIVGTGGTGLREFARSPSDNPLSAYPTGDEIERSHVNGVLKLTLRPNEYAWEFLVSGEGAGTALDPGSTTCH